MNHSLLSRREPGSSLCRYIVFASPHYEHCVQRERNTRRLPARLLNRFQYIATPQVADPSIPSQFLAHSPSIQLNRIRRARSPRHRTTRRAHTDKPRRRRSPKCQRCRRPIGIDWTGCWFDVVGGPEVESVRSVGCRIGCGSAGGGLAERGKRRKWICVGVCVVHGWSWRGRDG